MGRSSLALVLGLIVFLGPAYALGYDPGILTEADHDPSFEASTEKWTYTSTGSTYGATTDPSSDGAKTFRSTSSTTAYSGRTLSIANFATSVVPGHEYRLEVDWFASGTEWADNRIEINIEWYDAGSSLLSTSTAADLALSQQNNWELKTLQAAAPANAAKAKVLIRWKRLSGTTSGRQQSFDRIALLDLDAQSPRPNAPTLVSPILGAETTNLFPVFHWAHNDTNATPQAQAHLQISASADFSAALFEDTMVSTDSFVRIASALPTPSDSELYWRVRTSNQGTNFSSFPPAATFRLRNLAANASFESWTGPLVGDSPLRWVKLSNTTGNHVRQSDTAHSGGMGLQLQNITTSFDRGVETDTGALASPVSAGMTYRIGTMARKNNVQLTAPDYTLRLQVDWLTNAGIPITASTYTDSFTAFDVWRQYESPDLIAPSDAAEARLRIQAKRTGGSAQSSDHIYIDDVYLRPLDGGGGGEPGVGSVVINEIMWDELEYIELHNHTANAIDIADWEIVVGGDLEVTILAGATIPAGGFYLVADAGAVSFAPDQEATMTLLQGGELVQLRHFNGTVIDTANQEGAWFAGQNTSEGIAMSRIDPEASGTASSNWADDLGQVGGRNGSPGQANIFTPVTSLVGKVVINEIMWDELEYIELANISDTDIDISDWQLLGDGSAEFTIDAGKTIPAGGYFLIAESGAVTVTPDQTATMTLLQGGELLTFINATGLTIDTANQSGAWFAGQNTAEGIAMSRIDSTVSGALSPNWADDLGAIGGRNGSPGQANVFTSGGGGGVSLSDSELILATLDSWVTAFETADSALLREVFSPNSAFIQMFNQYPDLILNDLTAHDLDIHFDTITVFINGNAANVDVRGGMFIDGVESEPGGYNRFKFRKENGVWKLWET